MAHFARPNSSGNFFQNPTASNIGNTQVNEQFRSDFLNFSGNSSGLYSEKYNRPSSENSTLIDYKPNENNTSNSPNFYMFR